MCLWDEHIEGSEFFRLIITMQMKNTQNELIRIKFLVSCIRFVIIEKSSVRVLPASGKTLSA